MRRWYKRGQELSLRFKLVLVFLITILLAFAINLHMYAKISQLTSRMNSAYDSNVSVSTLRETLGEVQENLYDYLNGGYDSLNAYYQSESALMEQACQLYGETTDDPVRLKEKKIRNMITSYLKLTDSAVTACRGNDVSQYSTDYEEASRLVGYLEASIEGLNSDLFVRNTDNSKALAQIQQAAQLMNLLLLALCAVAELVTIMLVTERLIHPLSLLSKRAKLVGQGRLDLPPLQVYSQDEVGQVTSAFNQMMVQLNDHIRQQQEQLKEESRLKEEQLRLEASLKEAQLGALQSQINPHFLYNTLNAGEQLALMEDAERTCLFLEKVSNYFRYNLHRSGGDVTLEEELTQAENYIYIMNTRFDGEILYLRRCFGEIPEIRLPGMILQPLVENAIEHGLRAIEGEKCLFLTVQEKESQIIVSVSDNGAGFDAHEAEAILSDEDVRKESDTHGIGMVNVLRRLRLYYGRKDVLEIGTMEDGQGTEIRLLLPKEA